MKRQFSLAIILLVICMGPIHGQHDYLVKSNKADAQSIIKTLKGNDNKSQDYKNTLGRAITNYISYNYYASEEALELFDLVIKGTKEDKNEYYRFLLLNAEFFSVAQTDLIKCNLEEVLQKSDPQFYDIVPLYHLEAYKSIISSEVNPSYFTELRAAFISKSVPVGLLEKARPLIALANMGNVSIEDSIINIVREFYARCLTTQDVLAKRMHYMDLGFGVVPKILGRINSKRSLEQTMHLMLDDYVYPGDGCVGPSSMYQTYINYVLTPKLYGRSHDAMFMKYYEIEQGDLTKKAFVDDLIVQIKTNQLRWKKTLTDVD